MLIKKRDCNKKTITLLNSLLSSELDDTKKFLINRELKNIKSGGSGEDDAAYYLDFYYGKSKNWAIIHDLRIEYDGLVAQIDHLLISRFYEIYVLESKSYGFGVKITENGEFEAYYGKKYFGIPSPLEQNKRHIRLIDKFIKEENILPTRIGIPIKATFKNYILISPKSIIKRPNKNKFDSSTIIKADTLETEIEKEMKYSGFGDVLAFAKVSKGATIMEVAKKLASFHIPKQIDYYRKFGIEKKESDSIYNKNEVDKRKIEATKNYFCAKCKVTVTEKVAKFCWSNINRFQKKVYCFNCQKSIKSKVLS